MRGSHRDARKRLMSYVFTTVAWLGTLAWMACAGAAGTLPWQDGTGIPLSYTALFLILTGISALIAALPDDAEDFSGLGRRLTALLALGVLVLLLVLMDPFKLFHGRKKGGRPGSTQTARL